MSTSKRKGFTVIELLVAVGVTALLVTLMINIVTTVLTNWNRTSGSLSSGNQARLVLDQISQDLQGVILKSDSNVWLAASVQTTAPSTGTDGLNWSGGKPSDADPATNATFGADDSLRLSPDGSNIEDYRFGQGGVWLRFFTIPSGENDGTLQTISAPRAVGYQIIRRRVGSGTTAPFVYQLFRSEVTPDLTFNQGYNLLASNGYNTANAAAEGAVENIRSPIPGQVIASGVIDFGIRLFAENPTSGAIQEVFPVNRIAGATSANLPCAFAATSVTTSLNDPGSGAVSGGTLITDFPTVAEVLIRVLTPEGIRLLEAKEAGEPVPGTWWEIAEQNSQVYTRRIDIKSTAL